MHMALLFLRNGKKERRCRPCLTYSARMCKEPQHNAGRTSLPRFPSAAETMEQRSKSSPFPWASWFSSHNLHEPFNEVSMTFGQGSKWDDAINNATMPTAAPLSLVNNPFGQSLERAPVKSGS
ncbi:hypothetical protein P4O66_019376 [Electrophorus voltai]|uniref:Uncharacterized protein n=1 Tax=Electrophorus voltai TaxID=2609070 RepID=A0AAD8ZUC7_9TELE|nr:hypothetical protein P4O66_019376 [Electrophorus voltai]